MKQKTIYKQFIFSGIGLHTGNYCAMVLTPAEVGSGIKINGIPAIVENAESSGYQTEVCGVKTVEHILGFLFISGVDNVNIDVIGGEIPIMDGSADAFFREIDIIEQTKEKKIFHLPTDFKFCSNGIFLQKNESQTIGEYSFHTEEITMRVKRAIFPDEINVIRARTFCFEDQVFSLKSRGLIKGGSVENAMILDRHLNPINTALRSTTEVADHKILDLFGDFSLLGLNIGHFTLVGNKTGHKENIQFVRDFKERLNKF